jgi:quinol monooxygenase YgiN
MTDTAAAPACQVLELRQYTLRPGQRDALIELFEREFIESQEALGMTLFGQFRDIDDPDRFVWLRGFADMPARAVALAAFYDGPVWRAHREAANATMLDSDDVLLLRPARPDSALQPGMRPTPAQPPSPSLVVANLWHFAALIDDDTLAFFDRTVVPLLTGTGSRWLATLVTEPAANTFPRLPVREGEHVLACFTAFDSIDASQRHAIALESSAPWQAAVGELRTRIVRNETLRLAPTARSRLPRPRGT